MQNCVVILAGILIIRVVLIFLCKMFLLIRMIYGFRGLHFLLRSILEQELNYVGIIITHQIRLKEEYCIVTVVRVRAEDVYYKTKNIKNLYIYIKHIFLRFIKMIYAY